jgi:hypothetical protein
MQAWAFQLGGCGPGCGPFPRSYFSSKEVKEMLEEYRSQLEKELAGVEERIKDLKSK